MRPHRDEIWLEVASTIAKLSTCLRRAVGCVLVNARGHVLSTGYNGVAPEQPHCNELVKVGVDFEDLGGEVLRPRRLIDTYPHQCAGANMAPGTGLELCEAIHSESNALLQCHEVWNIDTCYVTHSPCIHCAKLLCVTSCRRVVFLNEYAHGAAARDLFLKADSSKEWVHWVKTGT